jgi:hypothetical protein
LAFAKRTANGEATATGDMSLGPMSGFMPLLATENTEKTQRKHRESNSKFCASFVFFLRVLCG